jgi:hypothetical protein
VGNGTRTLSNELVVLDTTMSCKVENTILVNCALVEITFVGDRLIVYVLVPRSRQACNQRRALGEEGP